MWRYAIQWDPNSKEALQISQMSKNSHLPGFLMLGSGRARVCLQKPFGIEFHRVDIGICTVRTSTVWNIKLPEETDSKKGATSTTILFLLSLHPPNVCDYSGSLRMIYPLYSRPPWQCAGAPAGTGNRSLEMRGGTIPRLGGANGPIWCHRSTSFTAASTQGRWTRWGSIVALC